MPKKIITIRCFGCSDVKQVEVDEDGFNKWKAGEYIQVALAALTPGERELLISRTCETCFDEMCKELDDL